MPKVLKATFKKNCIGCEMCVAEVQHQLGKVGLEGSPIRIFRAIDEKGRLTFSVDIDPRVNELDIEKIAGICPTLVFTIEEESDGGLTS
jgi:hypothetical protein